MTDDTHISIDEGSPRGYICIEERYMRPTAEYPQGSYLRKVAGNVEMATGWYEKEHPGHPSLYFHKGPPFVMLTEKADWPKEFRKPSDNKGEA
jgi:hypothetical protein